MQRDNCQPQGLAPPAQPLAAGVDHPAPALQSQAARWLRGYTLFGLVLLSWLCSIGGAWLFDGLIAWSSGLLYIAYDTWLLGYVALRTRGVVAASSASNKPKPPLAQTPMSVSVVIAARNEATVLGRCLDLLLEQADGAEEILVVDDGSTDGSFELLQRDYAVGAPDLRRVAQSSRYPQLRVLHKAHSGKADSLNQALQVVHGDVVITLDADTLVAPGAIDGMRQAFVLEPALVATCGVLTPKCRSATAGRFYEWFQTFEYLRAFLSRIAWMKADALLLVSGAFAGYRRDALLKVGGYDPRCLVEDYELVHRLHRHAYVNGLDWRVTVLGEVRAETDAPAGTREFLRQRRRWFAGFLQTLFRNRDMIGNRRFGAVGGFMLPLKSVDTLQPIYGLTAFVLLLYFLASGQPVIGPIFLVIGLKLAIDFIYHLWAVRLYHRWLGQRPGARIWLLAVAATIAEPFSFQLLRHFGALLGWLSFLSGRIQWGEQRPVLAHSSVGTTQ